MLLTKPVSLSANARSESSHINNFYEQLSDGVHEISLSAIKCVALTANNTVNSKITPKFLNLTLPMGGNLNGYNINSTMETNNYLASVYKNKIAAVSSTGDSFQQQLIMSMRTGENTWQWIILGEEGSGWNNVIV